MNFCELFFISVRFLLDIPLCFPGLPIWFLIPIIYSFIAIVCLTTLHSLLLIPEFPIICSSSCNPQYWFFHSLFSLWFSNMCSRISHKVSLHSPIFSPLFLIIYSFIPFYIILHYLLINRVFPNIYPCIP